MVGQAKRKGFSLVELVVVVLIIGILAAVAAPKMFDSASDARESGTRQSLAVVRDAIELYKAQNGSYPSAASLAEELRPLLKGPFPRVQVGGNQNQDVAATADSPIVTANGNEGWIYNESTGEIAVNDPMFLAW